MVFKPSNSVFIYLKFSVFSFNVIYLYWLTIHRQQCILIIYKFVYYFTLGIKQSYQRGFLKSIMTLTITTS